MGMGERSGDSDFGFWIWDFGLEEEEEEEEESVGKSGEKAGAPTPVFGRTSPLGEVGCGDRGCGEGQVNREMR
jgi:hypothetical protein